MHQPFDKIKKVKNLWSVEQSNEVLSYMLDSQRLGRCPIGDSQAPNSFLFSHDSFLNVMGFRTLDKMKEASGRDLFPTYTYGRIYRSEGPFSDFPDELVPHKDRPSCEISATITIGYPEEISFENIWPVYIQKDNKKIKCVLDKGDALLYAGCQYEHWRDPIDYEWHAQLFIHYVDKDGPFYKKVISDFPHLSDREMFDIDNPKDCIPRTQLTEEEVNNIRKYGRKWFWDRQGKTLPG